MPRTAAARPRGPRSTSGRSLCVFRGDLWQDRRELQSLDTQRRDRKLKQTAVRTQLNELRGAGGKSYKTITVRVAVTQPGKLDIALKYAVPGASWRPRIDARLRAADRAVELTYFGLVRNGTGEDWSDIALTLLLRVRASAAARRN